VTELSEQIQSALAKPKRVRNGVQEVEQHSPKDLIEADRYLAQQEVAQSGALPIGIFRISPPGSI